MSLIFFAVLNLKLYSGGFMKLNEAVAKRIYKILKQNNITINKLASMSCLTQSTVECLINGKSKNPKLLTIIKICDGVGISLYDFFDDELFFSVILDRK